MKETKNSSVVQKKVSAIATVSSKKLLATYSPENCLSHSGKITTIQEAMKLNAPTIGTFQREKGRKFTEGLLKVWLVYLNRILNLNKPMTEDQIKLCAVKVVDEYYALKFTDLTLLFNRIISGEYGEFYESLTIPKVLSFFRNYFDERCNEGEQMSQEAHNDFSSDETFNYSKNPRRILK